MYGSTQQNSDKKPPPDLLMLPFLIKICYAAALFAGMVQGAYSTGGLGSTSGHSGNLVKMGTSFSRGVQLRDFTGWHWKEAFTIFHLLAFYIAGNFAGGVWTNHDKRKTLHTAGSGLIVTGSLLLLAALICFFEGGLDLQREVQQIGCFAMGLQNGVLVATTSYANTVTTSGNLTDIGILLGQAVLPGGRTSDKFWKGVTLAVLSGCFIGGATVGASILFVARAHLSLRKSIALAILVPAVGLLCCGSISILHSQAVLAKHRRKEEEEEDSPLMAGPQPPQGVAPTGMPSPCVERKDAIPVQESLPNTFVNAPKAPARVPSTFVTGSYICCLFAGMVDLESTRMLPGAPTPTHVTGPSVRFGSGIAALLMSGVTSAKEQEKLFPNLKLISLFVMGATLAGVLTSDELRRTRKTGGAALVLIGLALLLGFCVSSYNEHLLDEVQHLCGFAMGFQNGALCSITGFARTTHMTGNLANVGICLGQQSNPDKDTVALRFKLRANGILSLAFAIGVVLENLLIENFQHAIRFVSIPATGLVVLGFTQMALDHMKQQRVAEQFEEMVQSGQMTAQEARRSMMHRQLEDIEALRALGCEGGFSDTVTNLAGESSAERYFCEAAGDDDEEPDEEAAERKP